MLHHIVMWKLKDFAEGKSKAENARMIKERLENLKHIIPEIKKIEVGINMEQSKRANFDAVLDSYFESYEAMERYQNHPDHKLISEWIGKIRDDRSSVDYEI